MEQQIPTQNPQQYYVKRHQRRFPLYAIGGVLLVALLLVIIYGLRLGSSVADEPQGQETPFARIEDPLAQDKDQDGLLDSEEVLQGLSDTDFDTDADGISDAQEIERWGTDPKNPDTDGDGFSDGFELLQGYSPTGTGTLY